MAASFLLSTGKLIRKKKKNKNQKIYEVQENRNQESAQPVCKLITAFNPVENIWSK